MSRNSKRLVIIFVYIILFGSFGSLIYFSFTPKPSCSDGKQNQGEERVDCGGPCAPCVKKVTVKKVKILEKKLVYGGRNNRYDVLIKLNNPNNQYGLANFKYTIKLLDNNGATLATREGVGFILPKETRYLVEQNFDVNGDPKKIEFEIADKKWKEFTDYVKEPELNIYNKSYTVFDNGNKNKVFGLLKNESYFDFNTVEINIVLRDKDGNPVALGKNMMNTVNSQEQRDFTIIWPYRFPGEVQSVEIEAEADVFNSSNFIKRYLPKRRFQNYSEE